jgi:lipopolysaccharide transport system permease protein
MSSKESSISHLPSPTTVLIIEPGRTEKNYWADLWRYRELFIILAWRDISVRYKQTIIGILWAIIRPFLTMVVFTVIFGRIAKLPSDGSAPYALMVFAAMLPWSLFSNALSESSNSLIGNANLIGKVYFPRLIIPAATLVTAFIDFLISFVILIGMMIYYQFARAGTCCYCRSSSSWPCWPAWAPVSGLPHSM